MGHGKLANYDRRAEWPEFLKEAAPKRRDADTFAPTVIRMEERDGAQLLKELASSAAIDEIIDNYDEQLAELYISQNAHLYRANPDVKQASTKDFIDKHYEGAEAWRKGSWVYFPWRRQLVHVLEERLFFELRTIRNKNLIDAREQSAFSSYRVGCAGMSVGSSGAVALILQGGSSRIKISDGATISGSNLNRIRTGVANVGEEKSLVVARQLYEMNPYIEVHRAPQVTPQSVQDFIAKPWPLDILIDEIDDLEMKIRLRIEARKRGIPVLMATDIGDDVMLDVERFDLDSRLPLFHGLAGKVEEVLEKRHMTQREWLKYATLIVGTKNVPLRMQQSLLLIGTKLPTQPQLGGTATMAGSVLAYAVRKLALGESIKGGRSTVSLDKELLHISVKDRLDHRRHTKVLERAMESM